MNRHLLRKIENLTVYDQDVKDNTFRHTLSTNDPNNSTVTKFLKHACGLRLEKIRRVEKKFPNPE